MKERSQHEHEQTEDEGTAQAPQTPRAARAQRRTQAPQPKSPLRPTVALPDVCYSPNCPCHENDTRCGDCVCCVSSAWR